MRNGIACFLAALMLLSGTAFAQSAAPMPQAPPSAPPFSRSMARAIDAAARAEIASHSTPGLAIGVVQDGLLVYSRGFGYANVSSKRAVTASTEFYAGSLTKQFTAACVLMLAQQKKLSLDDKITKYIPELSIAKNVTIRELLEQTAGLPDVRKSDAIPHDLSRPINVAQLLKAANALPMSAKPGTTFEDSNFDYLLAGLIVQRVSGLPLSIYYSTQIFEPLIMTSSFLAGDQGISARHAVGYTRAHSKFMRVRAWDPSWLLGSSDLVTTVQDLAKWDIGMPLLLNVESVREMWSGNGLPGQLQYGMGWVVDERAGQRYVWQNGQLPGFRAMNALLPSQHIAVIVLANADSLHGETTVEPERLANKILNIIAPLAQAHFENTLMARAGEWLSRLARNDIDRTQLTPAFSQYLTNQLVHQADFGEFGPVLSLTPIESYQESGDTVYVFDAKFRKGVYRYDFTLSPDGKIDGLFLQTP